MHLNLYFVAAMVLSTILVASPSSAVDVTACGQEIPAGEVGVLTADLDCSGMAGSNAVLLGVGATFDLQGHTLTGPPTGDFFPPTGAVSCDCGPVVCRTTGSGSDVCFSGPTPCTVTSSVGIGVIRGFNGIVSERSLIASNLLIQPDVVGIYVGNKGRLEADSVTLEDGTGDGILGYIRNGGSGRGVILTLSNVTVTGFDRRGIDAWQLRGSSIELSNNGFAAFEGGRVKVTNMTATGNGALTGTTAPPGPPSGIDSACGGVCGGKIRLRDSVLTGSSYRGALVDITSGKKPKVDGVTCDVSANLEYGGQQPPYQTWGVCQND